MDNQTNTTPITKPSVFSRLMETVKTFSKKTKLLFIAAVTLVLVLLAVAIAVTGLNSNKEYKDYDPLFSEGLL